jgi:predicted TIM-barrel enzyme
MIRLTVKNSYDRVLRTSSSASVQRIAREAVKGVLPSDLQVLERQCLPSKAVATEGGASFLRWTHHCREQMAWRIRKEREACLPARRLAPLRFTDEVDSLCQRRIL